MKFLTLLVLATTSLASPLHSKAPPKDTIGNSLDSIGNAVEKCASVITGWNGELVGAEEIIKASNAILEEMKKATTSVSNLKTLNLLEAMAVIGPTNTLSGRVDAVTAALLAKKEAFQKIGVLSAVTETLKEQKTAADELQKAVMSKMPALASGIAGPMAKQFGDKLDAAIQQMTR
jgi:hypothetical protein